MASKADDNARASLTQRRKDAKGRVPALRVFAPLREIQARPDAHLRDAGLAPPVPAGSPASVRKRRAVSADHPGMISATTPRSSTMIDIGTDNSSVAYRLSIAPTPPRQFG